MSRFATIRFSLLGPLTAETADGPILLGPPRHQRILAMLLLEADRIVSMSRLVDELWEQDPPSSARTQVHNSVSTLRRTLAQAGAADDLVTTGLITTTRAGVRLDSTGVEIDLHAVDRLIAAARIAPCPEAAASAIRQALGLWTGPSLAGLRGTRLEAAAAQLDERRLALIEECAERELEFGDPGRLIDGLAHDLADHPLRERLAASLMLAAYRAGRQADALAAFRTIREHLVDELGLEPGRALAELHQAILRGDPRLHGDGSDGPGILAGWREQPTVRTPAELPPARPTFTGRHEELGRLDAWLADSAGSTGICVVVGGAGAGKTSLVTQWAHTRAAAFPGGQLWVNLRGYGGTAMEPVQALAGFLRALGVPPGDIPAGADEAAALYRTLVADRRILVVLDNAGSDQQITALLPGGRDCAVLITSRDRLTELVTNHGAHRLRLAGLRPDDAIALLGRTVRDDRIPSDPDGVRALAEACGHLPLALCVAATRLVDDPFLSVSDHAGALRNGALLASAADDDASPVRLAFDQSYANLRDEVRRMFRLLGLVPGADVSLAGAAMLAGLGVADTRVLLDRLCAAHLLEQVLPDRYAMHDLLRHYARQLLRSEEATEEVTSARKRLVAWYVGVTVQAASAAYPYMMRLSGSESGAEPFPDAQAARTWLETEQSNLVALIVREADGGDASAAVTLTDQLRGYFLIYGDLADWLIVGAAGVRASAVAGAPLGRAAAHLVHALAYHHVPQHARSIAHNRRALRFARLAGSELAEGNALTMLAMGLMNFGRLAESETHYLAAIAINRRLGLRPGIGAGLANLSTVDSRQGHLRAALEHISEARDMLEADGNRFNLAMALVTVGETLRRLGRFVEAEHDLLRAIEVAELSGNNGAHEIALRTLGRVLTDDGRPAQALTVLHEALNMAERFRWHGPIADAYSSIGQAQHALGDHRQAIACLTFAVESTRRNGEVVTEFDALCRLAAVEAAEKDYDRALATAGSALAVARRYRMDSLIAYGHLTVAEVLHAAGDVNGASSSAREALDLYQHTDEVLPLPRCRALVR